MRDNGIVVERTRKFKATMDSDHAYNIAPNLLERDSMHPTCEVQIVMQSQGNHFGHRALYQHTSTAIRHRTSLRDRHRPCRRRSLTRKAKPMIKGQTTDMATPMNEAATVIGSVAADLRDAAVQKYDEAVTEVKSQAKDAKANVAGEVKDVAMALRRASEDLRGGSAQERTLGQIATSLADASDALRDKDLGEILQTVNRVARNNPLLFLGGAVVLGFAASRFAKATSDPAPMGAAGRAPTSARREFPELAAHTAEENSDGAFGFVKQANRELDAQDEAT